MISKKNIYTVSEINTGDNMCMFYKFYEYVQVTDYY